MDMDIGAAIFVENGQRRQFPGFILGTHPEDHASRVGVLVVAVTDLHLLGTYSLSTILPKRQGDS
jgi:hypothetical protein